MRSFITVLVMLEAAGFVVLGTAHVGFLVLGAALALAGLLRVNGSPFADVATLCALGLSLGGVLIAMVTGAPHTLVLDAVNRAALLSLLATVLFQLTTPSWVSTGRSSAAVRIDR